MLKKELDEYGLPPEKVEKIYEYYKDKESILSSSDFEVAGISGLSINDVKKLKNFLSSKKNGVARDFLKRWGKVLSEENLEKAYEEYNKLSRIYPNSPVIWQIKGELLEKMDRHEEANNAYKKAKELYDEKGEIPPSSLEEKLHGLSYKLTTKGDGFGLVNGLGFLNGKKNSNVNGLSNGLSNGFKNGIINGSGLVNGSGSFKGGRKKKAPPIVRFFVTIAIIGIIIYAPFIGTVIFEKGAVFAVDGNFNEWNSVLPYYSVRSAPQDINITMVKFHKANDGLYFFIESKTDLFENASGIYIFIDSDMNSKTGYAIEGIGADFMVEIYGWNKTVKGKELYFYNSTNQNDYSQFIPIDSVAVFMSKNKMEGFIPHQFGEFRSVVISTNYAGEQDEIKIPQYGKMTAYIVENDYQEVIPFNTTAPVLKMEIYSHDAYIKNITFLFNGTSLPIQFKKISIYIDNGDGIFNKSTDKEISDKYIVKDARYVTFSKINLKLHGRALIFLTINCSEKELTGRTVVANISKIETNQTYVIYNFIDGGSYIHTIPQEVNVDGSFLDWRYLAKKDRPGDVVGSAGNPETGDFNLDILKYASSFNGHSLEYYMKVSGELFGGTNCPVKHFPTLPDSDRDTVPDKFDPYPHDFNNDGIPDNESYVVVDGKKLPDVDGDGIPDYPYGPDMWLNTTIPSWFPKPYAGRHVSVYIGPVPHHAIYGYDTLRIYINSDNNKSTGFSLPQYPLGADYMIEMYGIDGVVKNASLYKYNHHNWSYVKGVEYYKGYHSIEINSELHISTATSIIIMSDWDSDRDVSDTPMRTVNTKSEYVHEKLYLHYNKTANDLEMDTFSGTTAYKINLDPQSNNNNYAYWYINPPLYEKFDISDYPVVSLYLVPHQDLGLYIPGLNVSLYKYNFSENSATLIGYDNNPDIEDAGWYNFTIRNTTQLDKGETLVLLTVAEGGSWIDDPTIDIYFNSTEYNSLVDIPTDTYIHVNWIKSYNKSGETNTFNSGENMTIKTKISDPFGYKDILGAKINITDEKGNVIVSNGNMSVEAIGGNYTIFSYSLNAPSTGGEYIVTITGIGTNDVLCEDTYQFFVRTERGVVIYPDTTEYGNPGTNVTFNITVYNIGNVNDSYFILPSESTGRFPFYMLINGSLVAEDKDGDGNWDWINSTWDKDNKVAINLSSGESLEITVIKKVPIGTWGESDLLILTTQSISNSSVNSTVRLRTNVPVRSIEKVLYLHGTNLLALKHGTSENSSKINSGNSKEWTFGEVYYDVNLTGYITVNLYVKATQSFWSDTLLKVQLYAGTQLIGDDKILTGDSSEKLYTFTISPKITTIPKGSNITLKFTVSGYGTSATVYYDSPDVPSNITIPTSDFIKIRDIELYNYSSETNIFEAGERVKIVARITSPFGDEDIGSAYVNITNPLNKGVLNDAAMNVASEGAGTKIYSYYYTLSNDSISGYWQVRVSAHDDPVIWVNATTHFFIPWNVTVSPNHNTSIEKSNETKTITFNHTITNTGLGANIFEITVKSDRGFDVKLYINGTLAAEDDNGDGVWDYVNPKYDTDGDGNPDTGVILPGKSVNVTVAITVPANFNGTENTTVVAYSFLSQSVRGSAYDTIHTVPELHEIIIVMVPIVIILLIKRRRKFTPS